MTLGGGGQRFRDWDWICWRLGHFCLCCCVFLELLFILYRIAVGGLVNHSFNALVEKIEMVSTSDVVIFFF